jgi:nucleoside 2-deoxyribosyltransferase
MIFKYNIEVYLCGPMKGIEEFNKCAFDNARDFLSENGVLVQSPVDLNTDSTGKFPCRDYNGAMKVDIAAMCMCDAVVVLPGWENSQGAALEHFIAVRLGIPVVRFLISVVLLDLANVTVKRVE